MSKFNKTGVRSRTGNSFINGNAVATTLTAEGGAGYLRDEKSELFLATVSDFGGEATFYESADNRSARIKSLVKTVAAQDPEWIGNLVKWLRTEANMRSISLIVAMETAKALLDLGIPGGRTVVADALIRADEPGEALGYWRSQYGKKIPSAVKRGIADAAVRTYNEYSLGKYDTSSKEYRFGDVIRLTHPDPETDTQSALFNFAIARRLDASATAPVGLSMAENRKRILALPKDQLRELIKSENGSAQLKAAGLTWEAVAGSAGLDAGIWEALIPTMGYMALLKNLRNFEKDGVSKAVLAKVAARLSDPEAVAKSRQLPFRFLSAFRAVQDNHSVRFLQPLEDALNYSLANVPELKGNTLILVDRSQSMFWSHSEKTDMTFADTAALFGTALALRSEKASLVQFGNNSMPVSYSKSGSVLKTVESFNGMGGTETARAVQDNYKGHDRVIIITDEQTYGGYRGSEPTSHVPSNIPVYTWNLNGYEASHGATGANRHYFGGLTDQSFKMIPLLEAGTDANWPWED